MLQPFSLEPKMLATFSGAFYPTGYSLVMFPDEASAVSAGESLRSDLDTDEVFLVAPAAILSQITPTVADADDPLPSAGTEAATIRAYTKLAREGHFGILVKTPNKKAAERMMETVRRGSYSMAQRYRKLVIEDL